MKLDQLIIELNKFDLKRSIRLNKAIYIPNIEKTVKSIEIALRFNSGKRIYIGQFNLLKQILKKLEDENNR
jgi:hypothetical protein